MSQVSGFFVRIRHCREIKNHSFGAAAVNDENNFRV
jgi:hypothetical protein